MRQEWHDLLFAHWALPPEVIRRLVPSQFGLDLWDGQAYVGVVPFEIRKLRPRGISPVPVLSHFAEINVRTYVTFGGIPGVYFFSLDAANLSAVLGARLMYALPYYLADFKIERMCGSVSYWSRRKQRPKPAEFQGSYRPISPVLEWRPPQELLERFVSERYCLYSISGGHVYQTPIHHLPWPLQLASAEIEVNTMAAPLGIELNGPAPLLHYSKFIDVLVWWPERAD
jgi:uncharacterized protein YqjF (DUF2071 family)